MAGKIHASKMMESSARVILILNCHSSASFAFIVFARITMTTKTKKWLFLCCEGS